MDKKEQEARKIEKELAKLSEKPKAMIANDKPQTICDKMIALILEQGRPSPDEAPISKLCYEIFQTIDHVLEDHDAFMAFVKPLIAAKQEELV